MNAALFTDFRGIVLSTNALGIWHSNCDDENLANTREKVAAGITANIRIDKSGEEIGGAASMTLYGFTRGIAQFTIKQSDSAETVQISDAAQYLRNMKQP